MAGKACMLKQHTHNQSQHISIVFAEVLCCLMSLDLSKAIQYHV